MRRLLVVIVVLLVLAAGADRLAWKLAEREVGSRIQSSEGLNQRPDVTIGGFPFLTQVVQGNYSSVDATLEDLTVDKGVTVDHAQVHLTGLHLPLKSLVNRSLNSVPVDTARVTGNVSFQSLDAAAKANLPGSGLSVQFAQGAKGTGNQVALTGTFINGLVNVQISADASITVQNGQLVISMVPDSLNLPLVVRNQVARLLGTSYRMPALPLGMKVRTASVSPEGIAVTATGSNLQLGASGLG
jgi:hypothetical protein